MNAHSKRRRRPGLPPAIHWLSGLPSVAAALLAIVTAALLSPAATAQSMPRRTQTLQLQRGWNAVYLEVIPTNTAPASVFAGAPVNIVATFLENTRGAQFIRDPATIGWKKDGWGVWYSPGRPEAFLTSLHAINGNRAYLIQAERAFAWTIEGYVELARTAWKADAYNFVGFSLDPISPPTFEKFFSGSKAHRSSRLYRLVDDRWSLVANPAATMMRAGEAFWVETKGSSDYQGPVRVTSPDGNRVTFGDRVEASLVIANESRDPASVQIETVASSTLQSAPTAPPLAYAMRGITDAGLETVEFDLPVSHALPTLEAGEKTSFRLVLRRARMSTATGTTLLKISNGAGAVVWLPVTARRDDLSASSQ